MNVSCLIKNLCDNALPALSTECIIKNEYSGILATDLFSLNALLGSMIEQNVVLFLNNRRSLWDDKKEWEEYHFIRDNESFPDVRLVKRNDRNDRNDSILGIELKSWFILSKEGMPSFRFKTASETCGENDLLCIVPWFLSNVVCGNPVLVKPYVVSAKDAAKAVKEHWEKEGNRSVEAPKGNEPSKTNYKAEEDSSNNFGRLARTGIMDDYIKDVLEMPILGIPAKNWMNFLRVHTNKATLQDIKNKIISNAKIPKYQEIEGILDQLREYIEKLPKV